MRCQSLKEDSVVSSNPIVATKGMDGNFKAIHTRDFKPTKDKLNQKEHRHIMDNLGGGIEKHEKKSNELLQNWENHLKNKTVPAVKQDTGGDGLEYPSQVSNH